MGNGTDTHGEDPTPEQLERDHPGWRVWEDIHGGTWYAQPPAGYLLAGDNLTGLGTQIHMWEDLHAATLGSRRDADLKAIRADWGDLVEVGWEAGQYTAARDGSMRLASPSAHGLVRLLEERYPHGR